MENREQEQAVSRSERLQNNLIETRSGAWFVRQWENNPTKFVGFGLLGAAVLFLLLYFVPGQQFKEISVSVAIELASVALTVFIIDTLNQRRLNEQLKKQLVLQLGSTHNDITLTAIRTLKAFGWGFDKDKTLQDASLSKANLKQAPLSKVNLQQANLEMADLQRAALNQVCLKRARLNRANLEGANLNQADLQGAIFDQANMQGVTLNKSNMKGVSMQKADLQGSSLYQANLQQAQLNEAFLHGAGLGGADLKGAMLYRANLKQARLGTVNFKNANLGEANLSEAHLYRANLEEAVLYGANLQGANLREANFKGAVLYGADLRGAIGLTLHHLKSAKSLSGTILPDGTGPEEMALKLFEMGKIDEKLCNTIVGLAGVNPKAEEE